MSLPLTTDDLIDLVRDDIDEDNITDVSDKDVLQKLNRAQRHGTLKIIRNYDVMFLTTRETITVSGQSDYEFPSDIFADKFKKIQQIEDGDPRDISRTWYRQSTPYDRNDTSNRPTHYEIIGKSYRLYPPPEGGLTMREYYVRMPEPLVKPQGRITSTGTDSATGKPYVIVDSVGDDLTTDSSSLNNYVNVINHRTGGVLGSLQVASIDTDTNKVVFKDSNLTRTSVLGKSISTSLPDDTQADNYLSTVKGTCISEIPQAYTDYLVQLAVVGIKRSKGEPTKEDYANLKEQEEDLSRTWEGHEQRHRVKLKNPHFNSTYINWRR